MKRQIHILISILCIILMLTACGKVSNKDFEEVVKKDETGKYELTEKAAEEKKILVSNRTDFDVYQDIHLMANSIVYADEVWGKSEITEEKVNGLLLEVLNSNYTDKYQLIEILSRWKNGDFSHADKDHNYVWNALNGTVGEAYGIDWDSIPAWAEKKQ